MHLDDHGEPLAPELVRESHQSRPQSAMHEGELAVEERKATHVIRVGDHFERGEYLAPAPVAPPAPANRLARDRFSDVRHRSTRGGQHDAVLLDKCDWVD